MKNYCAIFYWFVRSRSYQLLARIYELCFDRRYPRYWKAATALNRQWRGKAAQNYICSCAEPLECFEPYGETATKTLRHLCKHIDIRPGDHIADLGCGRGFVALWFWGVQGCRVTAIDRVPIFIELAKRALQGLCLKEFEVERRREASIPNKLAERALCKGVKECSGLSHRGLEFLVGSYEALDLGSLSWVYLYGVGLDEQLFIGLTRHFKQWCRGLSDAKAIDEDHVQQGIAYEKPVATGMISTRVISVGCDLRDYSSCWKLDYAVWASYPWGWGRVYIFSFVQGE